MGMRIGNININRPIVQSGVDINEYMSDIISDGQRYDSVILKFRTPLKMEGPNASGAFSGFKGTEIPELDTSNVNQMNDCFSGCKNILTIPQIDTSNVTNMNSMFYNCTKLVSIPYLDTSNVNQMNSIFSGCQNISTIPQLDTSKVTNMGSMFYQCTSLTEIPSLDTGNATDMNRMFSGCSKLTTIPQLDTSKVTSMTYMFANCGLLTTVPLLDASNVTNMVSVFYSCYRLTTLGGFKDLGKAYSTTQSANYGNYTMSVSATSILTHDSLMNIINNLYDIATKGCKPQKLQLGSNKSKLTDEEIAIATNKGWTVS